jgi:2-octaprenyl-3-methyl-6-methoxy-1,4-benzoquinol hydroxylase
VVGADGASSQVRQLAGIGIHAWQYQQSCMLISVQCADDPGDSTWQQFTPAGPRAFLPLFDHWASLVWYDAPARIRQLQGMSMAQLQQEITRHFPSRLGEITPLSAGAFPLTRRHALQYVKPGLALVGDAAHTIHPLAGQGLTSAIAMSMRCSIFLAEQKPTAKSGPACRYLSATRRDVRRTTLLCSRDGSVLRRV